MADNNEKTFLTVTAGNVKDGTTKSSGNPYIQVGLVIKQGPRKGEWLNYFLTITPKTKERVKRDLEVMGVKLDGDAGSGYSLDRRLFTAVEGWSDFHKKVQVVSVKPSLFQPDRKESEDEKEAF